MTGDELKQMSHASLIAAMRRRAEIRRSIETRKSVQEGKADRIADMLEEAANRIELMAAEIRSANAERDMIDWSAD